MLGLTTGASALTILRSLDATRTDLDQTQARISTGLRVTDPADSQAYWSIATGMRSDRAALSTVKDALGFGSALVDVASTGLSKSLDLIDEIKARLVAARTVGADRVQFQQDIFQIQQQLQGIAKTASLSGNTWLVQDSSTPAYDPNKVIVTSFSRSDGAVSVGTLSIDLSAIKLYDLGDQSGLIDKPRASGTVSTSFATLDISGLTDSAFDMNRLDSLVALTDETRADVAGAASRLGAVQGRLSLQQDFITGLMTNLDEGIGSLVDADLSADSVRLQALQTQQELGVQALSIANANGQLVLRLFAP